MCEENEAERIPLLASAIPALEHVTNFMADSNAAKIEALHNLCPQLAHLANVLAEERKKQEIGLNMLLVDEKFGQIQKLIAKQRNEFDALDFIGELGCGSGDALWSSEEFHSNVLAWLLDPRGSHGLGDCFLTRFLRQAGMQPVGCSWDWAETEVTREWANEVDGQQGYLDILIVNHPQQILCAIENKVFSSEHGNQLTRYRKALEVSYPAYNKYYVFLTPRAILPLREEEKKHWRPLSYSVVFDIVQHIVDNYQISTNQDIREFLRQYITTLRRNIVPGTSAAQLARKTYLEHREAVELMVDNKPDYWTEAKQWLEKAIAQHPEWLLDTGHGGYLRFRSTEWDKYDATRTGRTWTPDSNALLLFEFTYSGRPPNPYLQLALSSKNEVNECLRQELFEEVRQKPQLFKLNANSLPDGVLHLHRTDNILDEVDFGVGWDDNTTRAKLEQWLADFTACEFAAMNEIIVGCLQEIDAGKQAS